MSTLYKTKSGSLYEVDGLRVRQRERSDVCSSGRVSSEWREAVDVHCEGVGCSLVIMWGTGRDEHSANAIQVGEELEGTMVIRMTTTTSVVAIEELP